MPTTTVAAWAEPGTVSLVMYSLFLLLRGRAGARLLAKQLKRDRETLADVAMDEFADFVCDHSDWVVPLLESTISEIGRAHV